MFIVPATFLFVLLIILVTKAPKAGAWVIGGLLLLAPILFYRFAMAGAFAHEEGIPLFVVPVSFLFVLLIILLAKAPKVGAALVVALVLMAIVGGFVGLTIRHDHVAHVAEPQEYPPPQVSQRTQLSARHAHGDVEEVYVDFRDVPTTPTLSQNVDRALEFPAVGSEPRGNSPIWSAGMEAEFEADVYPSRQLAVRALGARLEDWIRQTVADANEPMEIVLFQEENQRSLMWDIERALEKAVPEIRCSIEAESRNITGDEIGIELRLVDTRVAVVPWANTAGPQLASGRVLASARNRDRETTASQSFIEKPWVADFASFANERPDRQFIVARSQETCTSENQARQLAVQDAAGQLQQRIGKRWTVPGGGELTIGATELQEGGFIVDTFVQSFDGLAGRIWRQAMLIDAAAPRLRRLDAQMSGFVGAVRMSWARMGLSAIGVVVLIVTVYFFLNMATRGYYEWSLRIAGVVLAIVAVISVLMIVR
jgi:hypothetical protein